VIPDGAKRNENRKLQYRNVVYDETEYTISVTVTLQEDGTLKVAIPADQQSPLFENTYIPPEEPEESSVVIFDPYVPLLPWGLGGQSGEGFD